MKTTICLGILIVGTSLSAGAQTEQAAGEILSKTDRANGVICVIGAGDLALEIAKQSAFLVHALEADAAAVEALRQKALPDNLLGKKLYVDVLDPAHLPYSDRLINVLVSSVGCRVSKEEVTRVLVPEGTWISLDTRHAIRDTFIKPLPEGLDEWTHHLRGPDNNPVSWDTEFQMPVVLQYLGMPQRNSFQGASFLANGLRIELRDWVVKGSDRVRLAGKMTARDAYNGRVLWNRDLPENIPPDAPLSLTDGKHIYVASGSACEVLIVDALTGEDRNAIRFMDDDSLRVKWLAMDNDRLYALIGPALPTRGTREFVMGGNKMQILKDQMKSGQTIVAMDSRTGKPLWRHDEPVTIDYHTIAAKDGAVFFYSEENRLAKLDDKGHIAWENKDASWLSKMKRTPKVGNINVVGASRLIVGQEGHLSLSLPGGKSLFIFDALTGKYLWSPPDARKDAGVKNLFVGDRFITGKSMYDAATGNEMGGIDTIGGGCGLVTWAAGLEAAIGHVSFGMKSPCGVPTYVAGGILSQSPSQCNCWPHIRGAAGFISGSNLLNTAKSQAQHPLVKGSAFETTTPDTRHPTPDTSPDWPTYRGDLRRTGSASLKAGTSAALKWIAEPEHRFPVPEGYTQQRMEWLDRPTAPVTADGLAFYGSSDGAIRAVQLADGKTAWTYWTGGPVLTAPTIAEGRLYAGCGDGWVYGLDAATGELAWKRRGAPADQRITVYDKLMSRWPVISILVHDGKIFGAAGQWMMNGVMAFGMNAQDGDLLWTHWTDPEYDQRNNAQRSDPGYSPSGQTALVGDRVWIRSYLGIPGIFNTDTGQRLPLSEEVKHFQKLSNWTFGLRFATAGQDILVVDDKLVLQGGFPLMNNPDFRVEKTAARYLGSYVNENGEVAGLPLPRTAIPSCMPAPALDGNQLLFSGGVGRGWRSEDPTIGLSLWDVEKWKKEFEPEQDWREIPIDPKLPEFKKKKMEEDHVARAITVEDTTTLDMQQAIWRLDDIEINAVALAPDAAVAVVGKVINPTRKYGETPEFSAWKLTAFDRLTGQPKWTVDLPGEPIFNSIAPSSEGLWILTLRDGRLVAVGN